MPKIISEHCFFEKNCNIQTWRCFGFSNFPHCSGWHLIEKFSQVEVSRATHEHGAEGLDEPSAAEVVPEKFKFLKKIFLVPEKN
jgi:hypothetical protein